MEVAMLDEEEYATAYELYGRAFKATVGAFKDRHKDLLEFYNNLTGENETVANAIMHHRIAQYGPLSEKCNKPYRTPQASFCAACGNRRIKN